MPLNIEHEREGNAGRREWASTMENGSTAECVRMLLGACNTIDKLLNELEQERKKNGSN